MPDLYGASLTRRDLSARSGGTGQFAGVRLMTLGDGLERGIRMLEFRSGTGLRFTVLIDRAFDIADCDHNGRAVGWPGRLEWHRCGRVELGARGVVHRVPGTARGAALLRPGPWLDQLFRRA